VRRSSHTTCCHDSLKLSPLRQTFHGAHVAGLFSGLRIRQPNACGLWRDVR
jgi:3'-phosphoadenosine 5'-phosphosulfate sulfotransferase (PAPS reductase)/FAD synthetase